MKYKLLSSLLLVIFLSSFLSGKATGQDFPDKPVPPRLVNDFAGILDKAEADALEQKLVAFNDSTSTQIAIVSVNDLHGYDRADYAQQLAERWGIGQKELDNGILILIKPKTTETSRGEAFIAPGYGLEGVIPDIVCGEIVDYEILPAFRAGEYYEGLDKATSILMSLASGEFTADKYSNQNKKDAGAVVSFIIFIVIVIIFIIISKSSRSNHHNIGRKDLPLWILLGLLGSGRSTHKGTWGGFSGGGGFGGGGGGFGGFGGGSFGGGGAGGSW